MNSKLSKTRWQRIDSIYDEILQYPEEQQLKQLKLKCHSDDSLFEEIQSLLVAESNAPTLLDGRAFELFSTLSLEEEFSNRNCYEDNTQHLVGDYIGSYRLCEQIGKGGMGLVFLAERADGAFEQTVAIKILRSKGHQKEMIARFQREQQVLASLNHPNIAQLHDGGVTKEGVPYFVMEYVKGEQIDHYCDRLRLDIKSRLKLVIQIIDALSVAHKKFIIHRDIKPSNILVTEEGKIKLLDFGIAKLLSNHIDTEQTHTKGLMMTFGYAAPEQLLNKPITVETDIYQLGLVIYKLLTGVQAYQNEAASLIELTKKVCEQEPLPPSYIIKNHQDFFTERSLHSSINNIAKQRNVEISQLHKNLQGEVDSIILKTLAVDSKERYHSMSALKADIGYYFLNRPITAQKATLTYRVRKFLKRHWQASALFSIIFLLIIIYAITVTIQAKELKQALIQTEIEKEKALQVSGFMINMFKAADQNVSGSEDLTASVLLEQGHQKILSELNQAPEIQRLLLTNLGEIHHSRGEFDKGVMLLEQALLKQRTVKPKEPLTLANTLTKLAIAYTNTNQLDLAKHLFEEIFSIHKNINKQNNTDNRQAFAETNTAYAELLRRIGELTEAELYFEVAISILRKINNSESTELATALNGLAAVQFIQGFFEKSKVNMLEAINLFKEVSGEDNSYYTVLLNNYSLLLIKMEKFDEALLFSNKALSLQKNILGDNHPNLAETLRSQGKILHYQGQLHEAKDKFLKALVINRSNLSKDNFVTAALYYRLGLVLQDLGEFSDAKQNFNKMIAIYSHSESGEKNIARGLIRLASLFYTSGDLEEARKLYQKALISLPQSGLRTSEAQIGYAQTLLKLNEIKTAKTYAQLAFNTRVEKLPTSHSLVAEAKATLGLVLVNEKGTAEKGIEYLVSAEQVLRHNPYYQFGHQKLLMQSITKQLLN